MVKKAQKEEQVFLKKGKSAFFFFGDEHRTRLLEESITKGKNAAKGEGKKDVGYVTKQLGAMWGKMSDEQKAPFQKQADKDKLRHDKEKAAGMVAAPRKSKKDKKKKKDPNAPKRPSSGYFVWMNQERQNIMEKFKIDKKSVADFSKKAGELWKEVDESIKAKLKDEFNVKSAAWKIEMAQYKAATATAGGEESGSDGSEE